MSLRPQHLLRALLSLGSRASSSGGAAALAELRGCVNAAAAWRLVGAWGVQPALGAAPQQRLAAAAASLAQLHRGLHTGLPAAAAAEAPAINPLQQVPAPPVARGLLAPEGSAESEAPLRARAVLRGVAISPRKLNMFAKVVRRLSLEDALIQCEISCKKSARILRNVLLSARANAVNNHGLDADKLVVEEAWVGRGTHLKRTAIHGRGRSGVRLRYRSHLTIVLAEKESMKRRTKVIPMLAERYASIQERKLRGPAAK